MVKSCESQSSVLNEVQELRTTSESRSFRDDSSTESSFTKRSQHVLVDSGYMFEACLLRSDTELVAVQSSAIMVGSHL